MIRIAPFWLLLAGLLFAASPGRAQMASGAIPVLPSAADGAAPHATPNGGSLISHPDVPYADYQRGRYATALRDAMRQLSANPKDAAAMTLIGQIYLDGYAVKPDHAEADRWFALAAKLGDPQANFLLGRAYLEGDGVAKDLGRAKALFEQAATKNNAGALYNLGVLAIQSSRDFASAADYFRRAAAAGDVEANYALAELYRSGSGVRRDNAKAAALLRKAADQHDVDAEVEYGIALFNGDGVAKNEALAAKYLLIAAAANNPVAQDRIARMLAAGRGIAKNMVEAMKWHVLSRSAGVKDPWLDQQLATLTQSERSALREALRQYAGN